METDADSDGREHRFQPQSLPSLLCVRWRKLCYCSEPISPVFTYTGPRLPFVNYIFMNSSLKGKKEGREGGWEGGKHHF